MKLADAENSFLGLSLADQLATVPAWQEPRYRVIPFGLECSVSYGGGTKRGPAAIIEASQQVETFDIELEDDAVFNYGVETLAPVPISSQASGQGAALAHLEQLVEDALIANRFPVIVGGEHSITAGSIRPFARRYKPLTIVQFDAHADLRDSYEGNNYSHASAMRRCLDHRGVELIMIGIRNISREEFDYFQECERVTWLRSQNPDPVAAHRELLEQLEARTHKKDVYVTFDADGLDSTLMPATGTPEPGGIQWNEALSFLRCLARGANVRGLDYVEHAPIASMHAPDFVSAKLLYCAMNYFSAAKK